MAEFQPDDKRPDATAQYNDHDDSVVGVMDGFDEPQITPMRSKPSPPPTPDRLESKGDREFEDRGRPSGIAGSVILSNAAKKKKKKNKKPTALNGTASPITVHGFTPIDSGAEDSDGSSRPTPRVLSPLPRLPGLNYSRPQSPGVSGLRAQLEALEVRSRSTSRQRPIGSGTPSTTGASDDQDDSTEEMVSYDVPLDRDFVSTSLDDKVGQAEVDADQKATSVLRKMTADDFTPIRCLGDGAFGTVLLVRQKATGRLFAQKTLSKATLKVHKRVVDRTMSERQILELVNRQPFIVDLYYAFQDHERLYLILQYAEGGELFRHLELEKFFSEEVTAFYMAEIVLALDFLHRKIGVIYRDLKPENCLLDADGHLLLTDFGLSKVAVKDVGTPGGSRCNSLGVGTIEYMAPELIRGSMESDFGPGYGLACDWWSLGAMGCDLMTGKPPFGGGNWSKIQQNIMHQKLNLPFFLTPDAKDLLTRFLRKEPRKRLGVGLNDLAIIKKHRFFKKIDWKKLERREVEPPIRPLITDPALGENFATEFTDRPINEFITQHNRTLSKSDPFGGFSYVASHSFLEASLLADLDEEAVGE
ncbi:hypothetical protein LTS08_000577 [Lithohypha guttulata]|uniref:uncharacterized protein n=1 Tax=Lithohypha guttulata TaxID=1690604 RepID=UPI002DE1B635|nr:hypothetical protein LTR51_006939 [Lithohypha guttulata]KAK5106458.1 hypothetical protein LTS08_000577 [Lithohypha guttulata]